MSYNQFKKFKRWIWNSDKKYYMVEYGNAKGPKRLSQRKIYLENHGIQDYLYSKNLY